MTSNDSDTLPAQPVADPAPGQAAASEADLAPEATASDGDALSDLGEAPTDDVAADTVSQASWESFPASDAPGWRSRAA
jgi:hypothetical protein